MTSVEGVISTKLQLLRHPNFEMYLNWALKRGGLVPHLSLIDIAYLISVKEQED